MRMRKVGDSKPELAKRGLLTLYMRIINPLSSAAPQQCSVASCLHSVRYTAERRRNAGLTKDRQHGCRQVTWPLPFFLEDGVRTVHNGFLHLLFLSIILLSPLWRVLPSLTQRLPPGPPWRSLSEVQSLVFDEGIIGGSIKKAVYVPLAGGEPGLLTFLPLCSSGRKDRGVVCVLGVSSDVCKH